MDSINLINHFMVWQRFNRKIYHKTLTQEHISNNGTEKYIDIVFKVYEGGDGTCVIEENKKVNTKCIFLDKGGIKYILPSQYQKELPINMKEGFDCYLKTSDKTIYKFIEVPTSVKIAPLKDMSFRDLIHTFNPLPHTDDMTWNFLKIQAIASKAKGAKYRLCSPPSTGKSCNDIILHFITNDNIKVSKPTIAKLETLYFFNQKVLPDEMTSLKDSDVRDVEPFFLTIADESPTFTKHSIAKRKDMNEVDISRASCVFTYNDPASLSEGTKFFDDIWQNRAAFNSRYPAFLLKGELKSDMPKLNVDQANDIMEEHFDALRRIAKNIVYYITDMRKELKGYDRSILKVKSRHKVNMEAIIDGIEAYVTSQEEFNTWMHWLNDRMRDYKEVAYGVHKAERSEQNKIVQEEYVT